jgi:hypothetical protein
MADGRRRNSRSDFDARREVRSQLNKLRGCRAFATRRDAIQAQDGCYEAVAGSFAFLPNHSVTSDSTNSGRCITPSHTSSGLVQ